MAIFSFVRGPIKQAPKVGCAYRSQVVEAIRVCHDLATQYGQPEAFQKYVSLVSDFTLPLTLKRTIDILERLVEAAVKTKTETNHATDSMVDRLIEEVEQYPDLRARYQIGSRT